MDEPSFGPCSSAWENEIQNGQRNCFDPLKIKHLSETGAVDLSVGEMRAVASGTRLSVNPDVFLLDDSTTGLLTQGLALSL